MARPAAGNPELNSYVKDALLAKSKNYEELKGLLRDCRKAVEDSQASEEAVAQLSTLIGSLTANVSAINERRHEAIVSEVLGIKLWGAPTDVLASVLEFTRNLVVANSAFTHTCMQLIVYSFTPPPALAQAADAAQDANGPWRLSDTALAVHQPLLSALTRLLGLIPTAATNIMPLIVTQMPHKLRDRNTQCLYLSALFRIAEDRAGATIREALLTAVIEHLLSLDIEIKWESIVDIPTGEEEEEEEEEVEDMFELEELLANELDINAPPEELERRQAMLAMRLGERGGWEGAAAGTHGAAGTAGAQRPQQRAKQPVDEMANKLDSMMELVFEHLSRRIAAGEVRQLWDTLLAAFERTILNTHRSKFTQFLLFYTCAQSPTQCPQSLVRFLVMRLRDCRQAAITRAACAAYLASFLARAAFLPEPLVVKTLQELAVFCLHYCQNQGGGANGAAAGGSGVPTVGGALSEAMPFAGLVEIGENSTSLTQRHQVFYAAIQAVLYVLCYHMQPLVGENPSSQQDAADASRRAAGAGATTSGRSDPSERAELAKAVMALVRGPVWQILNHRLQPLGVCLPSVAAEFVHQAAALGLVDCKELLKQVATGARSQRPLEMFFPFDPYLLMRSSRYLQLKQNYVRWRHGHPQATGGVGAGAAAADSSDDEDEEGEDEEDEEDAAGAAVKRPGGGNLSDDESGPSSSDESDEDGELADPSSIPSDAVLHDPTHRLHPASNLTPKLHRPPIGPYGHHHHNPHHRGHGRTTVGGVVMGSSYMSYASAETASQGDVSGSPYGMSPHDMGGMLVQNPLGTSPGAVPMSLGTPEMHYIAQVPMRIGRR